MISGYDYLLLWLAIVILILFLSISLEKNIKIIIWNYLLISMCLAISSWFEFLNHFSDQIELFLNTNKISNLSNFLIEYNVIINLIIYFLILIVIFSKSEMWVIMPWNKVAKILFKTIFSPLTLLSTFVALEIIIFWYKIFEINSLLNIMQDMNVSENLYYFFLFNPIWIILPWITTIIFSIRLNLNFNIKKWWPHWHEEDESSH